jgi:hypothetical protein
MRKLIAPVARPVAEREIRSLSDQSGAPLAEVRDLFSHELARLEMGAKVGTYLGVLTVSNVRGMLRRKARIAAEAEAEAADKAAPGGRVDAMRRSEGDPFPS